MRYGKYEIKNVRVNRSMSEETENFSLDLWVDGVKFASVGNDGRGGCHRTHPYPPFTMADIARVEAEMAEDTFLVDSQYEKFDSAVNTLMSLADALKVLRKGAAFIRDGEVLTMAYRGKKAPDEALYAHVERENPGVTVLNRLPETEAAKLIVKAQREELDRMFNAAADGDSVSPGSKP